MSLRKRGCGCARGSVRAVVVPEFQSCSMSMSPIVGIELGRSVRASPSQGADRPPKFRPYSKGATTCPTRIGVGFAIDEFGDDMINIGKRLEDLTSSPRLKAGDSNPL
ncbi:hypothetical protein AB0H34_34840 [Saccharopolyspora shandongensis]|uniref:hypothetical protein n=1 Tax=Saccharopolyspora shandongensis TaxID=418495 RepID=UPI0033E771C9